MAGIAMTFQGDPKRQIQNGETQSQTPNSKRRKKCTESRLAASHSTSANGRIGSRFVR